MTNTTRTNTRAKTTKRIGPRMQAVADYVSANPGCTILAAALATRSNRNPRGEGHQYGYAAAHRAIRAGLINASPGKRSGTYALFPVESGDE